MALFGRGVSLANLGDFGGAKLLILTQSGAHKAAACRPFAAFDRQTLERPRWNIHHIADFEA